MNLQNAQSLKICDKTLNNFPCCDEEVTLTFVPHTNALSPQFQYTADYTLQKWEVWKEGNKISTSSGTFVGEDKQTQKPVYKAMAVVE